MPFRAPLDLLDDNPWQTRQSLEGKPSYDEAYLEELAADIERNGLMQVPVGRIVDAAGEAAEVDNFFLTSEATLNEFWRQAPEHRIQLAFGHNRRRAFAQLGRAEIPLELKQLTDEEMARQAWAENAQRKDLSPIEEALAIRRRMEAFGWTQKQVAGELGLGRSTVANKLRLLKLPEKVLEALRAGKPNGRPALSERQALAMLPVVQMTEEEREAATQEDCYGVCSVDDLIKHATEWKHSSEHIRKDAQKSVEKAQQYIKQQQEREEALARAKEAGEEVPKLSDLRYDQYDSASDDPEHYAYVEGCSPACECRAEAIGYSDEVRPVCLDPKRHRSLKGQATKRKRQRRLEEAQAQLEAFHERTGDRETSWSPAAVRVIIEEALRHASVKDMRPAADHLGIDEAAASIKGYDTRGEARAVLDALSMSQALRFVLETLVREDLRGYAENGSSGTKEYEAVMAGEPYAEEELPAQRSSAPLRLHGDDRSSPKAAGAPESSTEETSSVANGRLHCSGHLYEAWQAQCAGCGSTLPLGVGSQKKAAALLEEKHWAREPDDEGDLRWMCSACNELECDWTQNMKAI